MPEPKIYYSYHDIPGNNPYTTTSHQEFTGLKFSQTEIIQILIAMAVLTIAFSFALAPNPPLANIDYVTANIPIAFLAIATAFICHEIAHKYVAQRYGFWSEFRMYPTGLMFALFLSVFTGFVFAAPGAVQIFGTPTQEQNGKMAIAGPFTNLVLSALFLGLTLLFGGLIGSIAFFIGYINAFLAFFNLLPIGPMDGMKIFRWRKEIWIGALASSIGLLAFFLLYNF